MSECTEYANMKPKIQKIYGEVAQSPFLVRGEHLPIPPSPPHLPLDLHSFIATPRPVQKSQICQWPWILAFPFIVFYDWNQTLNRE